MSNGRIGDRVVAPLTGNYGTIVNVGHDRGSYYRGTGHLPEYYWIQYDNGEFRERVPTSGVEVIARADGEESMTHSTGQIEEIGENARQNGATIARLCARVDSLESAAKAAELRAELNARRIEEVADTTARRFEQFREELDHILETAAGRRSKNEETLDALVSRVESIEKWLSRLGGMFSKQQKRARELRDGPKSYDKRIGALEEAIANLIERLEAATDIDVMMAHRLAVIESRDGDPLRRVPGVYSGLGDDTTSGCDGSCQAAEDAMHDRLYGREERSAPDDPVSRDNDAAVSAIRYALSEELRSYYAGCLNDGLTRVEAVNRVVLHAKRLALVAEAIAADIAEENL